MGFVLKYCDKCSRRLSDEDFSAGGAVEVQNRSYCRDHAPAEPRAPAAAARTTTSARRRAAPPAGVKRSGRTTAISNRTRASGVTVTVQDDGSRVIRASSSEIPSMTTPETQLGTHRRTFKSDQKSRAGLVVAGVIVAVLAILGVVVASVISGGNSPRGRNNNTVAHDNSNTLGNNNADSGQPRNPDLNRNIGGPTRADQQRGWTDELSRTRELLDQANDAISAEEAKSILREAWMRVNDLIDRARALAVDASDTGRAEDLRVEIADFLGAALWDEVRPLVKTEQDAYRLQDAYELLVAIKAGERDDLVPVYVTDDADQFPAFFEQLELMFEECKAEWEAYTALSAATHQFLEHLPELRQAAAEATRVEGGFYNAMRMKSFLQRAEELLGTYPGADPTVVPRGGNFSREYERVFERYIDHMLSSLGQAGADRAAVRAEIEWLSQSHTATWFLTDEKRAEIQDALSGVEGATDALRLIRADVAGLGETASLAQIFRVVQRLRLLVAIYPLLTDHLEATGRLFTDLEALAFTKIEALNEALPNGDVTRFRILAFEYITLFGVVTNFAERVDTVSAWGTAQPRDDRAEAVALADELRNQFDRDADWPYITWGFAMRKAAIDELDAWIREDPQTRVFKPGTREPSVEYAALNRLLTEAINDINADARLVTDKRDAEAAGIVLRRIRAIQATNLLSAASNPNEVRQLEEHAASLGAFAVDTGRPE